MRTRLGILGFYSGTGPWLTVKGDEQGVSVSGLKEGESLLLEAYRDEQQLVPIALNKGDFLDFPPKATKYRFVKEVQQGVPPSSTCVQVLIT